MVEAPGAKPALNLDRAKQILLQDLEHEKLSQLEACLNEFLQPDTSRLRAAEDFAKEAFKEPKSTLALLYIMMDGKNSNIRQLAGTFFRKVLGAHWERLERIKTADGTKIGELMKGALLELLVREEHPLSRRAIAAAIAMVNKRIHWKGKWDQMETFLFSSTKHPEPAVREIGMVILDFIVEEVSLWLMDKDTYGDRLVNMYESGLKDPDKRVSMTSLKAFAGLAGKIGGDEEILQFKRIIPLMLNALRFACRQEQDDIVIEVLEILTDLAPSSTDILTPHTETVLEIILEVFSLPDVSKEVVDASLGLLATLMRYETKRMQNSPRMQDVLPMTFKMVAQQVKNTEDDAEDGSAFDLLQEMSLQFSNEQIFQPSAAIIMQMVDSSEPHVRAAGILSLGAITEGCSEVMRPHTESMLQHVMKMLNDPNKLVKRYGLVALSQFADNLGEVFLAKQMGSIINDLLPILSTDDEKINVAAAQVVHRMGANAEPEVLKPLLGPTLMQLVDALRNAGAGNRIKSASEIISAIGALAEGAEADFRPFLNGVMEVFSSLWKSPNNEEIRGRTMEAVANIAKSVGRASFESFVQEAMSVATGAIDSSNSDLTTNALVLLGAATNILQSDVGMLVESFAPAVLKLLRETKSFEVKVKRDTSLGNGPDLNLDIRPGNGEYSDSDNDDDDESVEKASLEDDELQVEDSEDDFEEAEIGSKRITSVRTGECEKLNAALELVREICESSPVGIEPYLRDIAKVIQNSLVDNNDLTVRSSAIETIPAYLKAGVRLSEFSRAEGKEAEANTWASWVTDTMEDCSGELIWAATNDNSFRVTQAATQSLQKLIEITGDSKASQKMMPKTLLDEAHKVVKRVLKGKTGAQGYVPAALQYGTFEGEDTKESNQNLWAKGLREEVSLLEAAVDLMAAVARRKGLKFEKKFKRLAPSLEHLLVHGETPEARSLGATGSAEGCLALGPAAQPYVISLRPILIQILEEMTAKDTEKGQSTLTDGQRRLQWGSIWCLGILTTVSPLDMAPHFPKLLELLLPILKEERIVCHDAGMVKDNVIFTLSRMIRGNVDAVPMAEIFPLILRALPLTHDQSELDVVCEMMVSLWNQREKTFVSHLPEVLSVSSRMLQDSKASDSIEPSSQQNVLKMAYEIIEHARTSGHAEALFNSVARPDLEYLENRIKQEQRRT